MDGSALRAHYRKGVALLELGCLFDSLRALKVGLALDATNRQILTMVEHLQRRIRDSFREGRTQEVHRAKSDFQTNLEERVLAECLAKEREQQQRRQKKDAHNKWKADVEDQQRYVYSLPCVSMWRSEILSCILQTKGYVCMCVCVCPRTDFLTGLRKQQSFFRARSGQQSEHWQK